MFYTLDTYMGRYVRSDSHPVLHVLGKNAVQIGALVKECDRISDATEQQMFIRNNIYFLANEIEKTGEFDLGPLEMISIGLSLDKIAPESSTSDLYMRYRIAGIVIAARMVGESPSREGSGQHYLRTLEIAECLQPHEIQRAKERWKAALRATGEVESYARILQSDKLKKSLERTSENFRTGLGKVKYPEMMHTRR